MLKSTLSIIIYVGIHSWDMAGGTIIVKEAGGTVLAPDGGMLISILERDFICARYVV